MNHIIMETGYRTTVSKVNGTLFAAYKQAAETVIDIARNTRPNLVTTMTHMLKAGLPSDVLDLWNRVVEDDWSLPSVVVEPASQPMPFAARSSA